MEQDSVRLWTDPKRIGLSAAGSERRPASPVGRYDRRCPKEWLCPKPQVREQPGGAEASQPRLHC